MKLIQLESSFKTELKDDQRDFLNDVINSTSTSEKENCNQVYFP